MIEITFEVKRIRHRNEETGYTVMDVQLLDHPEDVEIPTSERIVTGKFPAVHKRDEFIAEGLWEDAGKYGFQFRALRSRILFPETSKGMVSFLTRSVTGVGALVAKRIVERFKEEAFQVVIHNPDLLMSIKGVTEKKKDAIHRAVSQHKEYEEVALFLLGLGLSHMESSRIYEELGYSAITRISANPYVLMSLKGFRFKSADLVAKSLDFPHDHPERLHQGIRHFIAHRMQSRGDMYTLYSDIQGEMDKHLREYGGYEKATPIHKDRIREALSRLVETGKLRIELFGKDECVYLDYFHHAENAIVKNVSEKTKEFNFWLCHPEELQEYIREKESNGGFHLAEKQKAAIHMAMFNRLSILSGGPGTGKTHTINAIIDTVEHFLPGADVKLCAPTGRAAKRMTEMTGRPAETIHRLIQIYGGDEFEDEGEIEEVNVDFLIVDESSMIDAHVFHLLLKAVTERTRVLLVGDFNQLPSVGPGLILRDLMESGAVPVTILTEIFRQAQDSQIVTNAYSVIHGEGVESLRLDPKKGDFFFREEEGVEDIINVILNVIRKALRSGAKLDDVQVLSVLNGGDLGVRELNRRIQRTFNPKNSRKKEVSVSTDLKLREGDRVMQTKNNYDLNVFNGEVGKVERIETYSIEGGWRFHLVVDFGDRDVSYNEEEYKELVLAYAMSVHKSQGSEFKYVIMPIHHSLRILLNRNIIYTAWTRAREKVILIGTKEELRQGMDRVESTVRNSLIREKLKSISAKNIA